MHDDTYNVKYMQPDTVYEPMLFEALKQIRINHAMLKVARFADFRPHLKSFSCLERYIKWLEEQLTNIVTNCTHNIMEGNLSKANK